MIRIGQTRNLLRASSSLLEMWPRSAHHHPGQRHLSGRANRPDKSPHSVTCPKDQKFLANESGIHKRRLDGRPIPSATCPRESVLPIRLRPDFCVVFEGYAGEAEHQPRCREALKRSLRADILWG
jgi:hypothetical protein